MKRFTSLILMICFVIFAFGMAAAQASKTPPPPPKPSSGVGPPVTTGKVTIVAKVKSISETNIVVTDKKQDVNLNLIPKTRFVSKRNLIKKGSTVEITYNEKIEVLSIKLSGPQPKEEPAKEQPKKPEPKKETPKKPAPTKTK